MNLHAPKPYLIHLVVEFLPSMTAMLVCTKTIHVWGAMQGVSTGVVQQPDPRAVSHGRAEQDIFTFVWYDSIHASLL